jgi:hypothetical protein
MYVKGQAVSRCGEGQAICLGLNHFVTAAGERYVITAIVPEMFGKGGPMAALPGTVSPPPATRNDNG